MPALLAAGARPPVAVRVGDGTGRCLAHRVMCADANLFPRGFAAASRDTPQPPLARGISWLGLTVSSHSRDSGRWYAVDVFHEWRLGGMRCFGFGRVREDVWIKHEQGGERRVFALSPWQSHGPAAVVTGLGSDPASWMGRGWTLAIDVWTLWSVPEATMAVAMGAVQLEAGVWPAVLVTPAEQQI